MHAMGVLILIYGSFLFLLSRATRAVELRLTVSGHCMHYGRRLSIPGLCWL